jgi:hypothetical protein
MPKATAQSWFGRRLRKPLSRTPTGIIDGMEGDMVDDPDSVFHGKRMKNGWKNSGLPWNYDLDPERMLLPTR